MERAKEGGSTLRDRKWSRAFGRAMLVATFVAAAHRPGVVNAEDLSNSRLRPKTLGGKQFWGDVRFLHGWKIQHNVFTNTYRLIDSADTLEVQGTRERCEARLNEIRAERQLPRMKGSAVVLVHGLLRSSKSMTHFAAAYKKEKRIVVPFDYPSTQSSIRGAARYLAEVIKSLEGVDSIDFVTHSMGGLVVRALLLERKDPRYRRLVMVAPPNRGANLANRLRKNPLYKLFIGKAGQELADPHFLPTPPFPFAIIAGSRGEDGGFNPLIPGDDDGTVGVSETRLPGATDYLLVHAPSKLSLLPWHSRLIKTTSVIEASQRFLKNGRLRNRDEKRPIPEDDAADKPDAKGERKKAE